TPKNMQDDPKYDDVENDVFEFFENKLQILRRFGIENVIIDPGFGFGKTVEHNYSLLKNLNKFQSLNCPVLAGLSRKSMINKLLNISSKESLNGTSILNEIALQNGAKILRVHDVKEAKEAITIYNYLKGLK
ncbi:MAG: dihydropteroate synthase, partial [Bacteroidetes bacterium]|nr:dihydropteroate synthase [Bacteroidota bacterium]